MIACKESFRNLRLKVGLSMERVVPEPDPLSRPVKLINPLRQVCIIFCFCSLIH